MDCLGWGAGESLAGVGRCLRRLGPQAPDPVYFDLSMVARHPHPGRLRRLSPLPQAGAGKNMGSGA